MSSMPTKTEPPVSDSNPLMEIMEKFDRNLHDFHCHFYKLLLPERNHDVDKLFPISDDFTRCLKNCKKTLTDIGFDKMEELIPEFEQYTLYYLAGLYDFYNSEQESFYLENKEKSPCISKFHIFCEPNCYPKHEQLLIIRKFYGNLTARMQQPSNVTSDGDIVLYKRGTFPSTMVLPITFFPTTYHNKSYIIVTEQLILRQIVNDDPNGEKPDAQNQELLDTHPTDEKVNGKSESECEEQQNTQKEICDEKPRKTSTDPSSKSGLTLEPCQNCEPTMRNLIRDQDEMKNLKLQIAEIRKKLSQTKSEYEVLKEEAATEEKENKKLADIREAHQKHIETIQFYENKLSEMDAQSTLENLKAAQLESLELESLIASSEQQIEDLSIELLHAGNNEFVDDCAQLATSPQLTSRMEDLESIRSTSQQLDEEIARLSSELAFLTAQNEERF